MYVSMIYIYIYTYIYIYRYVLCEIPKNLYIAVFLLLFQEVHSGFLFHFLLRGSKILSINEMHHETQTSLNIDAHCSEF